MQRLFLVTMLGLGLVSLSWWVGQSRSTVGDTARLLDPDTVEVYVNGEWERLPLEPLARRARPAQH